MYIICIIYVFYMYYIRIIYVLYMYYIYIYIYILYLEILFIWTLARRVRNARNSQEIPVSWTYQLVDAAGICLLQAQPISKCTEFSKNCVHSAPVWPGSKWTEFPEIFVHLVYKEKIWNGSKKKVILKWLRPSRLSIHRLHTCLEYIHRLHVPNTCIKYTHSIHTKC